MLIGTLDPQDLQLYSIVYCYAYQFFKRQFYRHLYFWYHFVSTTYTFQSHNQTNVFHLNYPCLESIVVLNVIDKSILYFINLCKIHFNGCFIYCKSYSTGHQSSNLITGAWKYLSFKYHVYNTQKHRLFEILTNRLIPKLLMRWYQFDVLNLMIQTQDFG